MQNMLKLFQELGEDEQEQWRGWIQVYVWYIVWTFVNATMYPHSAQ
jgi:hypothetical protein